MTGRQHQERAWLDSDDPEPTSIGPVRYFDERRALDRLWLFLLRFVPKPLRTRQPFGRYFYQPEHTAWAKREAKRMVELWSDEFDTTTVDLTNPKTPDAGKKHV